MEVLAERARSSIFQAFENTMHSRHLNPRELAQLFVFTWTEWAEVFRSGMKDPPQLVSSRRPVAHFLIRIVTIRTIAALLLLPLSRLLLGMYYLTEHKPQRRRQDDRS